METQIESDEVKPTAVTPLMARLLNKPLLSRGRSQLVMSLRKREKLMCKEQELAAFLAEYPWWGQIEGWQREVVRRMRFSLERHGRALEATRLWEVLSIVGNNLGKDLIWPILSHLMDGGTFQCHGMQICTDASNSQKPRAISFEQFLAERAPADVGPGRLLMVNLLLKAVARLEDLVRSSQRLSEPERAPGALTPMPIRGESEG